MAVAIKSGQTVRQYDATFSLSTFNVTLPSAPTAGNLLLFCFAGDKDQGVLTLSGFTQLYADRSASCSLYYCYKISDGSEQTISPSWSIYATQGPQCWYAELEDTAVSGSNWQIAGQAHNVTNESAVSTCSSGTTGTLTADGLAVAFIVADSVGNFTGESVSNSYNLLDSMYPPASNSLAACIIATKSVTSGGTTETTWSSTTGSDQMSGSVAAWYKAATASSDVMLPMGMIGTGRV